jgi:hypothetical protein
MTQCATVKVAGHEFTAIYQWIESDDAVGHIAFAEIEAVYLPEHPDDIRGVLKPVIIDAIARECAKFHAESEKYIGYRADMERLEA